MDNPSKSAASANQLISRMKKLPLKYVAIIAGMLIVLLVYFTGFGSNFQVNSPEINVKAEDMLNDYIRDQATAEQKYKDKVINITGQLLQKEQFQNSQNYSLCIAGKNAAGKMYRINISVAPENVSMVNNTDIGDFVRADGKCVGIVAQDEPTNICIQIDSNKINQ